MITKRSLSLAPRQLPLSIKCKLLFGTTISQICWLIFGLSFLALRLMLLDLDIVALIKSNGTIVKTSGHITGEHKLDLIVNDDQVYGYNFQFKTTDGQLYSSMSFSNGNVIELDKLATVIYPKDFPSSARIQGMFREGFSPSFFLGTAFLSLFCFLSFVVILLLIGFKYKLIKLLGIGTEGICEIRLKILDNNSSPLQSFECIFNDSIGQEQVISNLSYSYFGTKSIKNGDIKKIFYDQQSPKHAIIFDELPETDFHGNLKPTLSLQVLKVTLIPLFSIFVNLLALLCIGFPG